MKRLGIDIGSLYIGSVLLENNKIIATQYREHRGDIRGELESIRNNRSFRSYDTVGVTGNFQNSRQGIIDSTLSLIEGAKYMIPACRNVFSIGGESFSLIFFNENGDYEEHLINPPCASGTGSFIEQQAERLKISAEELSRRAAEFTGKTPIIATRCAVFARTDIIHAMQEGYSLDSICAGLCEGIARNVIDLLVKGRELFFPVAVIGGVSLNSKIVGSIERILGKKVIIPEHSQVTGALGAALLGTESFNFETVLKKDQFKRSVRLPLEMKLTQYPSFSDYEIYNRGDVEVFMPREDVSLEGGITVGIDIGSTSTKAVIMNSEKEVAGGFYTYTQGEPIKAVQKLIRTIGSTYKEKNLDIRAVGTTGSGRQMIKELFSADFVINEITAHAKAGVFLNPEVDTIIEIGGQDSKFTRIRDGEVYFSTMNYVCAAGTGSFIEEQAKRLDVGLGGFSDVALGTEAPYTSDRCTVYMERDLSVLLSEGWSKEALAAAVLHSVRDNYMSKVVNRSPLGDYIVFQGATARNTGLVASFEQLLKKPIHVSPYCHLTGAMGAALICQDEGISGSNFIWEIQDLKIEEEICTLCSNHCLLTVATRNGIKTGWGMKCGRDYAEKAQRVRSLIDGQSEPEKRFQDFMSPLFRAHGIKSDSQRKSITIGIPKALYNVEYAPLWHNFLSRLGFRVVLGETSNKSLVEGKAVVNSDFCAPMILSHGYVKRLLDEGVDYVFYPAIVNEKDKSQDGKVLFRKKITDAYFCYYSQYLPTIAGKLTSINIEDKLLSPLIYFNQKSREEIAGDIYEEMKLQFPDIIFEEVKEAFIKALEEFGQAKKCLEQVYNRAGIRSGRMKKLRIAVLGRPYIIFDPVMNLNIPRQLEEFGTEIYWQDEFSLDGYKLTYANKYYQRMHWQYGKRIIKLAEYCARSSDIFTVYLTCFRCSPDSFLISYVKDIMTHFEKPFLILQLDEQSSDVGYTTRLEAGLKSFENYLNKKERAVRPGVITQARDDKLERGDTVLVLYLDQLISRFWADCFTRTGYRAVLLDADEKALNTGYQYASGGECMPLISIVGGVVEKVRSENLDPEKTFFYIPTFCMACNFPQFPIFADMAFHSAGLNGLKIGLINGMDLGAALPQNLSAKMFESYIIACIIYKMLNRIKPYEVHKGETEAVFKRVKKEISEAILDGKNLRTALAEAAARFRNIPRDESMGRKPRIGLLGDLYVKYNETVNQKIQALVQDLGGELIVPSMTEYPFHFYDADIRFFGDNPRHYRLLRTIEKRYEKIAEDLIGDQFEPDFAECVELMNQYKIRHYITGETSISVGRALYYIKNKSVDAIIHINPMFCCPGVVTASIYRRIQEDFHIPIIDIFYDGTGNPNRVLIPHIHYLKKAKE